MQKLTFELDMDQTAEIVKTELSHDLRCTDSSDIQVACLRLIRYYSTQKEWNDFTGGKKHWVDCEGTVRGFPQ